MASLVYSYGLKAVWDQGLDWANDTIKAVLINTGYTPSEDHQYASSITSYRVGTDQTLGSKSIIRDAANDYIEVDAGDPTWSSVAEGSTVIGVAIIKFVTNDSDSLLLSYNEFSESKPTNGGDITCQFNGEGIIQDAWA